MLEKQNENSCAEFRSLYSDDEIGAMLSVEQRTLLNNHRNICAKCEAWCNQHLELIQLAESLPQFDVSEGLTQRILGSVEKQSTPGLESSLLPLGVVAAVAAFVLVPVDSLQGLYGWGAGILGLWCLQLLMKSAATNEQLV
jgi:hypothetical protein